VKQHGKSAPQQTAKFEDLASTDKDNVAWSWKFPVFLSVCLFSLDFYDHFLSKNSDVHIKETEYCSVANGFLSFVLFVFGLKRVQFMQNLKACFFLECAP